MSPAPEVYPFLFIHHGAPDVEAAGESAEVFLWFRGPVAVADRARIEAGIPTPARHVWHWDREFCYLRSAGDSDESFAAFAAHLERWAHEVHAIAPIALLWGPAGAPSDDPWHRWSAAVFAETMGERLARYVTHERKGVKTLGWIRSRCAPLLATLAKRAPPEAASVEAASIATLDGQCRSGRPHEYVPRLSYAEGEVLRHGALIAAFVGDGRDWSSRLERLSPLAQLTFLASYDVDHARVQRAYSSLPGRLRVLVEALAPDERRAALPLLVMLAQTLTRDTPAFDGRRPAAGELAAQVLRTGYDQPGCRGATFARASRYLRWGRLPKEARAMAEEGLFRYGERRTLVRAALKAARAMGDEKSARRYEARLAALGAARA